MLKAYKYRLYPNNSQRILLDNHFNACRLVYNLALETKNRAYVSYGIKLSYIDLINQLPELKNEFNWLKTVDSQALQQSIIDLDKAFTQFFKFNKAFPNFKGKKNKKKSFRSAHGSSIKIENNKIWLPKFKSGINIIQDRQLKGTIKSATVSKNSTEKYFISIFVETNEEIIEKTKGIKSIGLDLGLSNYLISSKGEKWDNPRFLKNSQQRLKILQRRASKKKKGSNNQKKAYKKVALLHEKIANQRRDFLQKLSTEIVNNHDIICMEDLKISNMMKNHNLAGSIGDAGWGMFVEMIKYKCEWYGKHFLQIPTYEASTKVCNKCGAGNKELTLKDREWTCKSCNTFHDRDINAAKVILKYCLNNSGQVLPGEPVELSTLVEAMKQEDTQ